MALYFYPKDFTSGCAIEARNFQRDLAQYEKVGTSATSPLLAFFNLNMWLLPPSAPVAVSIDWW